MSKRTVEILAAFDSLPLNEQQVVAIEVLRRTREFPLDSGPITDEEIGESGRALAEFLDRDENVAPSR